MRLLLATAGCCGLVFASVWDAVPKPDVPPRGPQSFDRRTVETGWLRLRVPGDWSSQGQSGGTVVATPIAPGWSRAVSITAAPFSLSSDHGFSKSTPAIAPRSYQLWISATRSSRNGTKPGLVELQLAASDRVERPPTGVATQFLRTRRIGDRTVMAVLSTAHGADADQVLKTVNAILRTLRMVE
jgi:hypothetical protein